MTAGKLISAWTEEEQITHADLIAEYLEREKFLDGLRGKIRASEGELLTGSETPNAAGNFPGPADKALRRIKSSPSFSGAY